MSQVLGTSGFELSLSETCVGEGHARKCSSLMSFKVQGIRDLKPESKGQAGMRRNQPSLLELR